jgi:hypothetical protein
VSTDAGDSSRNSCPRLQRSGSLLEEALSILRGLIERVVIHPAAGGPQGELVGILELGEQCKTPGRSRASAEQIEVVAGACNTLCLLLFASAWIGRK